MQTESAPITSENKVQNVLNAVAVYPNPTNNFVAFELPVLTKNAKGILFNTQGQQVMQFSMNANNTTFMLDVSGLAKGVYILQVFDRNSVLGAVKVIVE